MSKIPTRSDWSFGRLGANIFNFRDKENNINDIVTYNLIKTNGMFKYRGLPESMPRKTIERMIQTNGWIAIPTQKIHGTYYAFSEGASLGGVQNEYYLPSKCIINNPYLKFNEELEIGKDVVIIPNDSYYLGLIPMLNKYASLQAENELSMHIALINTRMMNVFEALTGQSAEAINEYFKDLEKGELKSIVGKLGLQENLKYHSQGHVDSRLLTQHIEFEQYLKASCLNELGLNANYNMKRESINSTEAELNDDALLPLPDNMLLSRQEGYSKLKELTNGELDITVEYNSAWKVRNELMSNVSTQVEENEEVNNDADNQKDIVE